MKKRVLIVEDEINLGDSICEGLLESGFSAHHACSAKEALQFLSNEHFDVIVSDIMMSGISGLELIKTVRSKGVSAPFIFLTALGSTDDKVSGLELGADDYLVKPFEFRELVARIRSVIKRAPEIEFIDGGPLRADLRGMNITMNGRDLHLTRREFDLLVFLMKNNGRTISKKELTEEVWGLRFETGTNTIEVYINYLRKKMDQCGGSKLLETVHGLGYRLNC